MLTDSYMANEETFPTCGYLLFNTFEGDVVQVKEKSKLDLTNQELKLTNEQLTLTEEKVKLVKPSWFENKWLYFGYGSVLGVSITLLINQISDTIDLF